MNLTYHPFKGALFLGLGAGREKLHVSNIYAPTEEEFTMDVEAALAVAKAGWMWGMGDDGFWFGFDISRLRPFQATIRINAPGVDSNSQDYTDSIAAVDDFGQSDFITFLFRLGLLF
jgi:hypothetical protein